MARNPTCPLFLGYHSGRIPRTAMPCPFKRDRSNQDPSAGHSHTMPAYKPHLWGTLRPILNSHVGRSDRCRLWSDRYKLDPSRVSNFRSLNYSKCSSPRSLSPLLSLPPCRLPTTPPLKLRPLPVLVLRPLLLSVLVLPLPEPLLFCCS